MAVREPDVWDGYPAARERVFDMLDSDKITDVAILTGDIHSSWAMDVPRDPWSATTYDPTTASGSMAVELVTPAISSPPMFSSQAQRDVATMLRPLARHLKFLEGDSRGYVLLDVTPRRCRRTGTSCRRSPSARTEEKRAARFVCERGSSHLVSA